MRGSGRGRIGFEVWLGLGLALLACGGASEGQGEVRDDAQVQDLQDEPDAGGATLAVDEPVEDTVVGPAEPLRFSIRTTCVACTVRALSPIDGQLFADRPASDGGLHRSVDGLAPATHRLSIVLEHPDGRLLRDVTRTIRVDQVPEAPTVHLEPAEPTTSDDLKVVFNAYARDPDADPVTYVYRWARDGLPITETANPLLLAARTTRGERWSVSATPSDPWGEGPPGTAEVIIGNSPPSVATVIVLPSMGTADTEFRCVHYGWTDADGADPEVPRYAFLVSGVAREAPDDQPVFPAGTYRRGDTVACRVTPTDGDATGEPVTSAAVEVSNAPPRVASALLTPAEGDVTDTFTCTSGEASDPDGDPVTLRTRWRVGDELLPGETSQSLAAAGFARGQRIRCEVMPFDGLVEGAAALSNEVVLGDAPPSLGAALLGPAGATEGTTLLCEPGVGSDPDDDPVSYVFAWRVDGVPVPDQAGPTLTGTAFDKGQTVECRVRPVALGLEGPEVIANPSVLVENTPPSVASTGLLPMEGGRRTPFTCVLGVVSDPDPLDDPLLWGGSSDPLDTSPPRLRYEWRLDGAAVPNSDKTTFTPEAADAAPGQTLACALRAHDGQAPSDWAASPQITLVNHLPSLSGVSLEPTQANELTVLTCSTEGYLDPDGDPEATWVIWLVNGVALPDEEGPQLIGAAFDEGDAVACRATPFDGYEQGVPLTSASVVIGNAPPSVGAVTLDPLTGGPGTLFTCAAQGLSDPDGQDTPFPLYRWYRQGAPVDGAGGSTYTPQEVTGSETLACAVVPSDGQAQGTEVHSPEASLLNQPPSLTGASIEPGTLHTDTPARCVPEGFFDPEGAPPAYHYQWFVDSAPVEGQGDEWLDDAHFVRGDEVFCLVAPFDGQQEGATKPSAPVVVVNAPPGPFSIAIQPEAPGVDDPTLVCATDALPEDADGDTPQLAYAWLDDLDAALGEGPSLDTAGLTPCTMLRCEAAADDGHGGSSGALSEPVVFAGGFGAAFDGVQSRLRVPDDQALDVDAFTFEAWVRPADAAEAVLAARGAAAGVGWRLTRQADGALRFDARSDQGEVSLTSSTALAAGQWWHVAAQVADGAARLYVQGALQAGAALAGAFATTGDLDLGAPPFAGALDEVRLSSVGRYGAGFVPKPALEVDAQTLLAYPLERVEQQGAPDAGPLGLHGQPSALTDVAGACFVAGQPDLPPSAPGVAVAPAAPTPAEDLTCSVIEASVDPEGQPVTLAPYWYVQGVRVGASDGAWTLPAGAAGHCDRVTCRVVPHDGHQSGPWGDATVQVVAEPQDWNKKYHSYAGTPDLPEDYSPGGQLWKDGYIYGQVFHFDSYPVTVIGLRFYHRGTHNTGSANMRYREPVPGQPFGLAVGGAKIPTTFDDSPDQGWNSYYYADYGKNPIVLNEDVFVYWAFGSLGSINPLNRRVYYDPDGENPATENWYSTGAGIYARASEIGVEGDFLIELIIEGEDPGVCP